MLTPWRWSLTLVGVSVFLGAVLELAPPLLVKQIVDEHLRLGRSEGLLWIAALYLGATAAVQGMGFLTEYLTAIIAQGVLHRLRVRLFAHLQTLPLSYYDRTPLGDTISRCTADVETVSTLFTTAAAGGAVASSGGGQGWDERGHGPDGGGPAGHHRRGDAGPQPAVVARGGAGGGASGAGDPLFPGACPRRRTGQPPGCRSAKYPPPGDAGRGGGDSRARQRGRLCRPVPGGTP